jgi:DNA-binding response OmpR family regulator
MAKKILIADDEPNIVTSLEFLLSRAGFELRVVRDGQAALQAVEEFRPDLVLLDVMMPLLSGFEVCQSIRANSAWHGVKILMLTAKGREAEVSKGLALGADAYVSKPFSTKALLERVNELLAQ